MGDRAAAGAVPTVIRAVGIMPIPGPGNSTETMLQTSMIDGKWSAMIMGLMGRSSAADYPDIVLHLLKKLWKFCLGIP